MFQMRGNEALLGDSAKYGNYEPSLYIFVRLQNHFGLRKARLPASSQSISQLRGRISTFSQRGHDGSLREAAGQQPHHDIRRATATISPSREVRHLFDKILRPARVVQTSGSRPLRGDEIDRSFLTKKRQKTDKDLFLSLFLFRVALIRLYAWNVISSTLGKFVDRFAPPPAAPPPFPRPH